MRGEVPGESLAPLFFRILASSDAAAALSLAAWVLEYCYCLAAPTRCFLELPCSVQVCSAQCVSVLSQSTTQIVQG